MSTESVESIVTEAVKRSSGTVVVLGVATVIAGGLAMLAPWVAGTSVTILVAVLMVAGSQQPKPASWR